MAKAAKKSIPALKSAGVVKDVVETQANHPDAAHLDIHSSEPKVVATPKAQAKEIAVVALGEGTYDGLRRVEGEKFVVKPKTITDNKGKKVLYSAEEQLGSWMQKI